MLISTHRVAISGQDVVINNINSPFKQEEIYEIADLRAFSDELGDLTDYIVLVEDNYKENEKKEGIYKQTYKINLEQFSDVYYVLLIYNIDFNKSDIFETISINLKNNEKLSENQIILEIIKQLNIKIYNYQLIDSTYEQESIEGNYYQTYLITTTNREKINVLVEINVIKKHNFNLFITMGVIIVAVGVIIIILKRKKAKNV